MIIKSSAHPSFYNCLYSVSSERNIINLWGQIIKAGDDDGIDKLDMFVTSRKIQAWFIASRTHQCAFEHLRQLHTFARKKERVIRQHG
jgi:hypothetical protein